MLTIHPVQPDEIAEVKELLRYTWTDTYGHFMSTNTIQKITTVWHSPASLAAQVKNPAIYFAVAKDETGKIVGLITARKITDQTLFISRLYIHPQHQRQGIGSQLLQEAINTFPEAKVLQLEVEEKNQKGRQFYLKQGFQSIQARQEEIEGELIHHLVMEKKL